MSGSGKIAPCPAGVHRWELFRRVNRPDGTADLILRCRDCGEERQHLACEPIANGKERER